MLRLTLVLFLCSSVLSKPFQCPQSVSTSGSFPANSPVELPRGFSCNIDFNIPRGYVVKFEAQKTQGPDGVVVINDMLSESHSLTNAGLIVFAPADSAQVLISTSESATFFVKWIFVPLTQLQAQKIPTNSPTPLTLRPFHPVTFFQDAQGPVRLLQDTPNDYQNVLVYDGADLTAPCIGRLGKGSVVARGSSLTLVVFDGSVKYQEGWFLAVEADAAPGSVTFHALSRDTYQETTKFELSDTTIFFTASHNSVIESITSDPKTSLEIRAGTPVSQASNTVLAYEGSQLDNRFPQQINSRLYSIVKNNGGNAVSTISKSTGSSWSNAYLGRQGSIIGQSVWDAKATANYDTTFTSTTRLAFTFTLNGVHMLTDNESLVVEIGDDQNENQTFSFNQTIFDKFGATANGKYMRTTYSGAANERSTFWVDFEIKEVKED